MPNLRDQLRLDKIDLELLWICGVYTLYETYADDRETIQDYVTSLRAQLPPADLDNLVAQDFWRGVLKHGNHIKAGMESGLMSKYIYKTPAELGQYTDLIVELGQRIKLHDLQTKLARAIEKGATDQARALVEKMHNLTGDKAEQTPNFTTWTDLQKIIGDITWSWDGWLPNGLLTVLVGEQGLGKSILALAIAASFMRGDNWPNGTPYNSSCGRVLWVETEASQALNLQRVKDWGINPDLLISPFSGMDEINLRNADHKAQIENLAHMEDVVFIVVDSLSGASPGDENKTDVMQITKFLALIARDTNKPVQTVHHLRKKGLFDGDEISLDRIRGASAITQPARVIWAIDMPDKEYDKRRRLSVIKNNMDLYPDPIGFEITDTGLIFGDAPEAPRVETVTDQAADLLRALLQSAPMRSSKVEQEFSEAGISWTTAKRAKKKLKISSTKREDGWYWSLPVHRGDGPDWPYDH